MGQLSSEVGLAELLRHGLLREDGSGRAAFRHALSWEAFYADVPWLRRRDLHRRLADALEAGGGHSMEIATHWLGARDATRARNALVRAAPGHAYALAALAHAIGETALLEADTETAAERREPHDYARSR